MPHHHEPQIPLALEAVVTRLGELEVVLGTQVAPTLAAVRATLVAAMSARDRGDVPAAIGHIGQAMDRLTALADQLDPAEATLMRALAGTFRAALLQGDESRVKETAATMFQKSGAVERTKN
ncbi:MAG TPA: hypothetical protein VF515_15300 [Candidatus Binatia bacterium]